MQKACVQIYCGQEARRFSISVEEGLPALLRDVAQAFNLDYMPTLAFETTAGDRAIVATFLSLRAVLAAGNIGGRLVVAPQRTLPSVDECLHTVFTAMVDTAAKGKAAANFLSQSTAYDHVPRISGEGTAHSQHARNVSQPSNASSSHIATHVPQAASSAAQMTPASGHRARLVNGENFSGCDSTITDSSSDSLSTFSSPIEPSSPMSTSPRTSRPSSPSVRHVAQTGPFCTNELQDALHVATSGTQVWERRLGLVVDERAPPASSRPNEANVTENMASDLARAALERKAVACFCTHFGVSCARCNVAAIQGTRYRCTSCAEVNLCERCKRVGGICTERHFYTVYDHPWEASDEYKDMGYLDASPESFKAPPAPLQLGDKGPRVMHLHFVLYTLGYLFLLVPGFRVDVFGNATQDAVERFQLDHTTQRDRATARDLTPEQNHGTYNAHTRAKILTLFEDFEARLPPTCRSSVSETPSGPRFRSAMAA